MVRSPTSPSKHQLNLDTIIENGSEGEGDEIQHEEEMSNISEEENKQNSSFVRRSQSPEEQKWQYSNKMQHSRQYGDGWY